MKSAYVKTTFIRARDIIYVRSIILFYIAIYQIKFPTLKLPSDNDITV